MYGVDSASNMIEYCCYSLISIKNEIAQEILKKYCKIISTG